MYVLSRSYVGRVPENLKCDVHPRRHSPKTEKEDYNELQRETHDVGPYRHSPNKTEDCELKRDTLTTRPNALMRPLLNSGKTMRILMLVKTVTFWISNLRVLMVFSFLSLRRRAFSFLFEVLVLCMSLLNVTDPISSTHVVGLLVGLLVVWVHFGWFSMMSTGRSPETWSQDLMRLGLIDSHENSHLTRVILKKISISLKSHERDRNPTLVKILP